MIDRKFIGRQGKLRRVTVEPGQLRFFAMAIGETNPVYVDVAAAHAAGYPAIPGPPTFGIVLESLAPDPALGLEALAIPVERLLHGEQEFRYHRPILAGDTVTLQTRVNDIYEKKGGKLEFVEWRTTVHNADGALVLETRNLCVVRNP